MSDDPFAGIGKLFIPVRPDTKKPETEEEPEEIYCRVTLCGDTRELATFDFGREEYSPTAHEDALAFIEAIQAFEYNGGRWWVSPAGEFQVRVKEIKSIYLNGYRRKKK